MPPSPITTRVWKSDGWRSLMFVAPLMAFFAFLGTYAFILEHLPKAAVIATLIGLFFCLVPFLASTFGHTTFQLGIDQEKNTLWTQHGKNAPRSFAEADRTIDFFVQKVKFPARGLGYVSFSGGNPRYRATGSRVVWNLMIHRRDSIDWDVAAFTTQREASEACEKANALLGRSS